VAEFLKNVVPMKKDGKNIGSGFTLIELLVVIAIIAVLAVVVVLTLNPAGLLQEARDANRLSDMSTFKSSLSLYLIDVPSSYLGSSTYCYLSIATTTGMTVPTSSGNTSTTINCAAWFASTPTATILATTTYRSVVGAFGWIPVDMSQLSVNAPFAQWPIDPLNNGNFYYSYAASTTGNVFKVAMFMESTRYKASGTADVVSTDGGVDPYVFEGGTNLSL
jgi:prepilin-type N-terminal cleavage/methylation domain-containing protein